jgi:hypothetical protein
MKSSAIVLMIFGLLVFAMGVYAQYSLIYAHEHYERDDALIVGEKQVVDNTNYKEVVYIPGFEVEYTDKSGKKYVGTIRQDAFPDREIGENIEVVYNPHNPAGGISFAKDSPGFSGYIVAAFGMFFVITSGFDLWRSRRRMGR